VVTSFIDNSRHREELRERTFAAIEPILGLHQAVQNYYEDVRRKMIFDGWSSTAGGI
jgi:hypothetical protein